MWWSASGHLGIWEFGNFTRLAFERFDGRAGAARMSVVVVVVVVVVSLELHFQFFSHTPAKWGRSKTCLTERLSKAVLNSLGLRWLIETLQVKSYFLLMQEWTRLVRSSSVRVCQLKHETEKRWHQIVCSDCQIVLLRLSDGFILMVSWIRSDCQMDLPVLHFGFISRWDSRVRQNLLTPAFPADAAAQMRPTT